MFILLNLSFLKQGRCYPSVHKIKTPRPDIPIKHVFIHIKKRTVAFSSKRVQVRPGNWPMDKKELKVVFLSF